MPEIMQNKMCCSFCGKHFKYNKHLVFHIQRAHKSFKEPSGESSPNKDIEVINLDNDGEQQSKSQMNANKKQAKRDHVKTKIGTTPGGNMQAGAKMRTPSWMTRLDKQKAIRRKQVKPPADVLFVRSAGNTVPGTSTTCWNCTQCKTKFLTNIGLEQHMKKEHGVIDQPVICSSCKIQFTSNTTFLGHLQHCRKPEQASSSPKLICTFCRQHFNTKTEFQTHNEQSHPEIHNFRSTSTNRIPSSMSITIESLCGQCSDKFNTRGELEDHLKANHLRPCSHCSEVFTDPISYQDHLRSRHMCLLCGFYGAGHVLDLHRMEHVFPCIDCHATFETKEEMEDHIEKEHPASCGDCQDVFSWPEPGHRCYFTVRGQGPTSGRVVEQVLYKGYFFCTDPVLPKFRAALREQNMWKNQN